jgi:hypothetical protein
MGRMKYITFLAFTFLCFNGCDGKTIEESGLGCFCTTDGDCTKGTCIGTTCSTGGIECVTDDDCSCGKCFTASNGVAGCMRTCDTAEQCYDIEQCSVPEFQKNANGLYYHWCIGSTANEDEPDYPQIDS